MDDDSYDNDQESLPGSHHRKAAVSWKKPLQSYKAAPAVCLFIFISAAKVC